MRWYLDTSVALHAILPVRERRTRTWLDTIIGQGHQVLASTLLELELIRAFRREGLDPGRARPLLRRLDLVSIDDGVLRIAAAIEPHVRSLDAIHLATCSLLGSGLTVATHDLQMAGAARSLGFDTFDPVTAAGR
ncbi:MAG TPA: type II toxin-antitoxin system VapC family toxin [Gemmatimonadales bacterium]|nr:type II toxin-antitoxin system VapC family toxin [Gemmatimonadales bacterium]